jgi:hypothetical protein
MRFEVLTAVAINTTALRDVVPCTVVGISVLETPDTSCSSVTSTRLHVITFRKTVVI